MYTIRELRKRNGLSPPQMATALSIALSTYFDKEVGRRKFTPPEIVEICKMFDVRVEDVQDFQRKPAVRESTA